MPVTHLKNTYAEGELLEETTTKDFSVVRQGDQAGSAITAPLLPHQSFRVQRRTRTFRQVP